MASALYLYSQAIYLWLNPTLTTQRGKKNDQGRKLEKERRVGDPSFQGRLAVQWVP